MKKYILCEIEFENGTKRNDWISRDIAVRSMEINDNRFRFYKQEGENFRILSVNENIMVDEEIMSNIVKNNLLFNK